MPIIEIESAWRETGIVCPFCEGEWMTYSNGETRPQCGNNDCLRVMPDEYIWEWLITLPEFRRTMRTVDKWRALANLTARRNLPPLATNANRLAEAL